MGMSILSFLSEFIMGSFSNDYYQTFGDYMTIAYCCLVPLQVVYLKSSIRSGRAFYFFVMVIIVQTLMTFICLQALDSNKSVVVIVLVSMLAIYVGKPEGLFIRHGRLRISTLLRLPFLLVAIILACRYMPAIDISQFHIFDHDESGSVLTNSSMQSRRYIINTYFMDQFQNAPIFGDISIRKYMHSSLLSIQTHLGMIGSLLFWSFIILNLRQVYRHPGNEGLKAIALPILFVSIISSFFTWGPLWFLMGALYEYTPPSHGRSLEYDT